MADYTFQITLDDAAIEKLGEIKQGFNLISDRGAFIVAIALAAEVSHHLDGNGYLSLLDGTKIKMLPFKID